MPPYANMAEPMTQYALYKEGRGPLRLGEWGGGGLNCCLAIAADPVHPYGRIFQLRSSS